MDSLVTNGRPSLLGRLFRYGRHQSQSPCEYRDLGWAVSEGIGSPSRTRQQASAARQLTRTAGAARTNINDFRCGAKRQTVILTGLVAILCFYTAN